MKSALQIVLTLLFINVASAQHHGGGVTSAKIAELAAHRLGRLVDTGKIDESFIKNLGSLEIQASEHSPIPTDPAFRVKIAQPSNEEGKSKEVSLAFDMAGKFLSSQLLSSEGSAEVIWPDVDPVELVEASLHFVTESSSPDIEPYNKNLKKLVLKQKLNDDGIIQAVVIVSANNLDKQLEITLSTSGEFVGYATVE